MAAPCSNNYHSPPCTSAYERLVAKLRSVRSPSTEIVIGTNVAVTVHEAGDESSSFYGEDKFNILGAAYELKIPVHLSGKVLAVVTYPEGICRGADVNEIARDRSNLIKP